MALKFEITGDNSNLLSSLDGAREGVHRAAQDIEQSGMGIEDMFKRIGAAAGIAFSLDAAKSFIGKITEVRSFFQDIESSMEVFLGNQQKAAQFTEELKDYAYYNMFEFKDLADASKQMIAYGHAVDSIIPRLDQLSNIATGTKADLMELVGLYNRAKSLGEVGSQSLASWATKGLVVKDVLEEMGVEVEGTTVTFEQLNMAIDHVTAEGGMFHDLMLNQMSNISAEQGQLEDNLAAMYNEIGEEYQDFITGAIKAESWLVEHYKEVGSVIIGLIAAYGEYQAALKVTRAIEKTMAKQANEIEAQRQNELQQVYDQYSATNEVTSEEAVTAAIVQNTASREGNVTAIDEQIAALERKMIAEIEEQNNVYQTARETLDVLKQQEAQKDSEISTLKEQIDTAKEYIEGEKEAMEAALSLGDAEQAETIKTNIATESKRLETLQNELGAAQKEKNIIADQRHAQVITTKTALTAKMTMQEKLSNMQKAVSVVQTKAQTAATGLWTAMINGAKNALNSLKVAMASNPFGLALAAITTIISLLPIFSEETSSAAEEIERFGESAVKQCRNLETLMAVVDSTSSESKVHKDAVDELAQIYEEYGFKIDDEIDKLQQLKDMHDLVTEAIHKEGEERQKANLLQSYNDALEEATKNMRDALQNAFESAEYDGSGLWEDWDADEFEDRAKELTQIIGAIIQSEGDALATLTGDELEAKITEVNDRIEKAYKDMGLESEKWFLKTNANGSDASGYFHIDVDAVEIMHDYVDAIHSVTQGRNALLETFEKEKKAHPEVQKEVDYTTMSIADLAKKASEASGEMSDLGGQNVSPTVDSGSIEDAGTSADDTKGKINLLNGLSAKPLIDTTSIGSAILQTNTLLGNMWQLSKMGNGNFSIGGGSGSFSLGFNPNKFGFGQAGSPFSMWGGKKPVWGTIGGKPGVQWMPDIPITDPALLAQQELNNRVNGANSQKKVDDLLKEVNEAFNKATFDSDEYNFLKGLKERLEKKSRKKSGGKGGKKNDTASKIEKEQQKLEDLQDDLDLKRLRSIQDMQTRLTDIRLELMADGAEKVRLLQEQQNKEEIDALERQREDAIREYIEGERKLFEQQEAIKKAKNANYKEKKFDESTVDTSSIAAQYDELINLTRQNQLQTAYQESLKAMRDYLKEYGTIEQQRLAITQEYEQKITEATSPTARASLVMERDEALRKFDQEQLEEKIDWSGIFSDLQGHTKEYLIGLRDQLQGVISEGNLAPDQMAVVQEKLREINGEISKQNGLFQFQGDRAREHARLVQQAADAQGVLTKAKEDEADAEKDVLDVTNQIRDALEAAGIDRDIDLDDEILTQFDATSDEFKNMSRLLELLRVGEGKLARARRNTADATNKAKNAEDAKKRESSQAIADWFADAQQFITEKGLDQLPELFNQLGMEDIGNNLSEGLNGFNSAVGAAADFASGNYIGALVKGIDAVGSFGRAAIGLFAGNGNAEEMEKQIAELAKSNETLASAIDSLKERITDYDNTNKQSVEAYKKSLEAEKEWEANQRKAINARASEYSNSGHGFLGLGGKHSFNAYLNDRGSGWFGWSDFNKVLAANGSSKRVNSAQSLWNLTPEEMKLLRDFAPKAWMDLLRTDGESNPEELLNEYIERAGMVESLTSALNEKLTGYSWDGFRDSFGNLLTDLTSEVGDFSENMEDMLTKAILNSLLTAKYKDRIDALYKMIADAAEDDNITKEEADAIRRTNEAIANDMLKDRQNLLDLGVIKDTSEYKQEASSKGFQAMSQDVGQELNGRFTALQIAGESVAAQAISIYTQLLAMSQVHTSSNTFLSEIRNMMITGNSYLEDIAKYSKKIYLDFATKLDDIVNHTK